MRAGSLLKGWWEALGENLFLRVVSYLIILLVCAGSCVTMAQPIPSDANRYKREYQRIARSEWGLSAPVSSLAAQIHQESGWNCAAVSRVGAGGCAQFMPTTAKWIGEVDRRLSAGDLYSPTWAFRAQAVYMRWLVERMKADTECERLAFAMQSYNSGLGWVYRRQKLSRRPGACFAATCNINPGVTAANQREAQEYPVRILRVIAPRYVNAGWGRNTC